MTRPDRLPPDAMPAADEHATRGDPDRDHLEVEVEDLRERLLGYESHAGGRDHRPGWQAATALVIAPQGPTCAIAFIRRAERAGDRWSGDMALPGGMRAPSDPDLATTAARETREEIGVTLGEPVTRLPDQGGRITRGTVATFVYILDRRPALIPQPDEVAEALWIPIGALVAPEAATRFRWRGVPFPAIDHGGRIIWGLTHRTLHTFIDTAGVRR